MNRYSGLAKIAYATVGSAGGSVSSSFEKNAVQFFDDAQRESSFNRARSTVPGAIADLGLSAIVPGYMTATSGYDAINAARAGKWGQALGHGALAAAGLIPGVGAIGKGLKYGYKGLRAARAAAKAGRATTTIRAASRAARIAKAKKGVNTVRNAFDVYSTGRRAAPLTHAISSPVARRVVGTGYPSRFAVNVARPFDFARNVGDRAVGAALHRVGRIGAGAGNVNALTRAARRFTPVADRLGASRLYNNARFGGYMGAGFFSPLYDYDRGEDGIGQPQYRSEFWQRQPSRIDMMPPNLPPSPAVVQKQPSPPVAKPNPPNVSLWQRQPSRAEMMPPGL